MTTDFDDCPTCGANDWQIGHPPLGRRVWGWLIHNRYWGGQALMCRACGHTDSSIGMSMLVYGGGKSDGVLRRLLHVYQSRKSIEMERSSYLFAALLGGAVGVFTRAAFGWPWWIPPIVLPVLVWSPSLVSAIGNKFGAGRGMAEEGLLYVFNPRKALQRDERRKEDMLRSWPWPLYGLPDSYVGPRWVGGYSYSGQRMSAVSLGHGVPLDETAPQLRVKVSPEKREPLRYLAESLWRGSPKPADLSPEDFSLWSLKQEKEVKSRPDPEWKKVSIKLDADPTLFDYLEDGRSWVAKAEFEGYDVTLEGRAFPAQEVELVRVDVERYILGRRQVIAGRKEPS